MTCLLDTHFLVWVITKSRRLRQFLWLEDYVPWGVSPISLLEIQLLAEVGQREVLNPQFVKTFKTDSRFIIDEVSLITLVEKSFDLRWTRDPFDRLIVAHSLSRRVPLCSVDSNVLENHSLVVRELRT